MNYGFETPHGWKSMDEWLDGRFFEKLENEGAVLLNSDYRKQISATIFHFTQLSIYFSAPELRAREQERSKIAEYAKALTELLDLNPDFVKFAREVMGLIDLDGPLKQLATAATFDANWIREQRRDGRPTDVWMDNLVVALGKIFADAGGNPAPFGGPFPRFLSVVWEKLRKKGAQRARLRLSDGLKQSRVASEIPGRLKADSQKPPKTKARWL